MTRSYRARRSTQPIALPRQRRRDPDPRIDSKTFTCYRLVKDEGELVAIELVHSSARMFAFTDA